MVAITASYQAEQGGRWLVYLTLSAFVNAILISMITLKTPEEPLLQMPMIQVNLMSLAKPASLPPPVKKAKVEPVVSPTVAPIVKPVVTEKRAIEKVVLAKPVPQPRLKPVLKKPVKKVVETVAVAPKKAEIKPIKKVKPIEPVELEKFEIQEVAELPAKKEIVPEKPVAPPRQHGDEGAENTTVVHEAQYRHQTAPVYPRRALDLGQQGTVTLHAKVLPSGRPGELKVVHSSGHRLLDMAALSAVKKWKFEPTNINGDAVVSWVRVPVNFIIQ